MAYKGQLSADFYIALVVFLGFLAYITFQLFQIVPAGSESVKDELIRIEAYQLSELLVNDGGHPLDWETKPFSDIKRIGLSDTLKNVTNFLSNPKITRFKTICNNNFNDIKTLLDIKNEASFTIIEHKPGGNDVYNTCKSAEAKKTSFDISRTVIIAGTSYPTELIVEVWRK